MKITSEKFVVLEYFPAKPECTGTCGYESSQGKTHDKVHGQAAPHFTPILATENDFAALEVLGALKFFILGSTGFGARIRAKPPFGGDFCAVKESNADSAGGTGCASLLTAREYGYMGWFSMVAPY